MDIQNTSLGLSDQEIENQIEGRERDEEQLHDDAIDRLIALDQLAAERLDIPAMTATAIALATDPEAESVDYEQLSNDVVMVEARKNLIDLCRRQIADLAILERIRAEAIDSAIRKQAHEDPNDGTNWFDAEFARWVRALVAEREF